MSITLKKFPLFRRACSLGLLSGALGLRVLAADATPDDAQARFEVDFMAELIDHHHAAVAMAELAADRAERPELLELADTLATAQAKEIKTMQGWLDEWYGETHEPEMNRRAERQVAALAELEGEEFDQAFLRALSLHHADALAMAPAGLLRAFHSDLIDLIREMVTVQSDEIALMRGWLMEWHDINEVTSRDRPDNRRWNSEGRRIPAVSRAPIIKAGPAGP